MHKWYYRDHIRKNVIYLDPNEVVKNMSHADYFEVKRKRLDPYVFRAAAVAVGITTGFVLNNTNL